MRALIAGVLAALALLTLAIAADAQTVFERMVMPGPLIEGHAKLEKDCANCHEPFSKPGQTRLCLACHKDIAADRQQARGFHGQHHAASSAECRSCHSEHKGRATDTVQLDRETFNHRFTRFALEGAHKSAACDACHKPGVKFRKAPGKCIDCHKAADRHKGNLGEQCDTCHNVETWAKLRAFDHSKTRFALTGSHANVACAACHAAQRYKGTPTACVACHQIQDAHQGRNGTKCETCHGVTAWAKVTFDHAKATRFPLLGAHAKVKCEGCHKSDVTRDKPQTTCISCHAKDDPHKGQLGTRCNQCHNETSWRGKVAFDHDLTRFPLLGRHASVPCAQCHRVRAFKDVQRTCVGCHEDKHHAGRLGSDCARCHTPAAWTRWRFDHDKQTQFALTGAHRGLDCHACHRQRNATRVAVDTACVSCHAADDAHNGSFGRVCEKCHTTATFKKPTVR